MSGSREDPIHVDFTGRIDDPIVIDDSTDALDDSGYHDDLLDNSDAFVQGELQEEMEKPGDNRPWITSNDHPGYSDAEFCYQLPQKVNHIGPANYNYAKEEIELLCMTEDEFVFLPIQYVNLVPVQVRREFFERLSRMQEKHYVSSFK